MTHIFINPENEYPRHMGDILLDDPNWDRTIENLPKGWVPVTPTDAPTLLQDQTYDEVFPTLVDGKYVQTWKVRDLTAKEIQKRDEYLASLSQE